MDKPIIYYILHIIYYLLIINYYYYYYYYHYYIILFFFLKKKKSTNKILIQNLIYISLNFIHITLLKYLFLPSEFLSLLIISY